MCLHTSAVLVEGWPSAFLNSALRINTPVDAILGNTLGDQEGNWQLYTLGLNLDHPNVSQPAHKKEETIM